MHKRFMPRQRHDEVRIVVAGIELVGAEVDHLVTGGANAGEQLLLESKPP
jgi:hypothetical protein